MKRFAVGPSVTTMVLIGLFATSQRAQEKPISQGIDAATVAAYESLGARYGGWVKSEDDSRFATHRFAAGSKQAERGLPGFVMPTTKAAFKFPQVPVPFGLDLTRAREIRLGLDAGGVTDADLKEVAKLKNITALYLSGIYLSRAGLQEIATLKNLATLDLFDCHVPEPLLRPLASLPQLTTLSLGAGPLVCKFDDGTLKDVATLKNLRALALYNGNKITDDGLKALAPLQHLERLDVERTKVTDAGLRNLASHANLTWLNLEGTDVGDAGMKALLSLKNLTTLNLESTKVTDAGLSELAPLKKLVSLDLSWTKLTGAGLKDLASRETLVALRLKSAKATDAEIKILAQMRNLQVLSLDGTNVTDAGLKELATLKNLRDLNLNYLEKVTDAGLKELASLSNLAELRLMATKVTAAGVAELQKALPKCKIYSSLSPFPQEVVKGPMPIYITPYYDSEDVKVNVGPFSKKLASADEKSILATVSEMSKQREKLRAETMYVMAIRLYDLGHKDDAVYWHYSAQHRAMLFARVLDSKKIGDIGAPGFELRAAYGAFNQLAGEYINGYAFGDVDKLKKRIKRVMTDEKNVPDFGKLYPEVAFSPANTWDNAQADVQKGINSLLDFLEKNADKIREQRKKNGLDGKY